MSRDPQHVLPSQWRAESPPRITSRHAYVAELIKRAPSLSSIDLAKLPDLAFDHQENTWNAVNTPRLTDAVARVLRQFAECGTIDPAFIRALVTNLTSERTAVGYAAQLQGYDWLLREGANFVPEVKHLSTLCRKEIPLDGRFETQHGGAFFDIKSHAFEPFLRAEFKRRLEARLDQTTVTIDGPGNHGPDAIQQHAFGELRKHVEALKAGTVVRINDLGWTVRGHRHLSGVTSSTAEYNAASIAHENRLMPLWFSSQFTVDAPYILMLVIPYGFGNPFAIDPFGSTVDMFDRIATHVFGPGRVDASPARDHDEKLPADVTVRDAVACLSGLALISEPGEGHPTTARIHLDQAARYPISLEQARSISLTWKVIQHPQASTVGPQPRETARNEQGRHVRWAFWVAVAALIACFVGVLIAWFFR
jgi:hypothetical protein